MLEEHYIRKTKIHEELLVSAQSDVLDKMFSKKVNFFWIPSHIGIHGNNEADKAAKSALEFEIVQTLNIINSLWQIFGPFVIQLNYSK